MVLVGVLAPKKPMLSVKEDFYQATIKVDIEYLNTKTCILSMIEFSFDRPYLAAIITEYGVTTKEMVESLIQRTLFPRSDIIVNVQIICDDGSVFVANSSWSHPLYLGASSYSSGYILGLNWCTYLQIISFSFYIIEIPVVSNIYAMSICVTPDGRFILDPEQDEEEVWNPSLYSKGYRKQLVVVFLVSMNNLNWMFARHTVRASFFYLRLSNRKNQWRAIVQNYWNGKKVCFFNHRSFLVLQDISRSFLILFYNECICFLVVMLNENKQI